jgi:hypothetical protein
VPGGVQHGLVPLDDSRIEVRDTDFEFVQFVPMGRGTLVASRLNGSFECVVLDDARLEVSDIPRDPGQGDLWVWPGFPPGCRATYTPPLPGFVDAFAFPPAGASGIAQSFSIERCQVKLWPLLVRPGAELTLKDIPEDNWVVVGFHLPNDTAVSGLFNGTTYADETLPLPDRTVRLQNASIDTWNFYAEGAARVSVRDSTIGELIASGASLVTMENVTVDGSGGYFGTGENASLEARGCTFTCDVQAVADSRMTLRGCLALPYPLDPTGEWTHLRAHDGAVLFLDQTAFATTAELGGSGAIAVAYIENPPASPPPRHTSVSLRGYAAVYSLDPANALASWRLDAFKAGSTRGKTVGEGLSIVEGGLLGTWKNAKPKKDYELRLTITDTSGRTFTGAVPVPHKR